MPRNRNVSLFVFICGALLLTSCKSAIQKDAESKAKEWWNESIIRCGDDYYTKYFPNGGDLNEVYMGTVSGRSSNAFIEFKSARFDLVETPLTEADKLNGIEWKGLVILVPANFSFRYYDYEADKWSDWRQGPMMYVSEVHHSINTLMQAADGVERLNTPQARVLAKQKGKWSFDVGNFFTKPQCSEIPKG